MRACALFALCMLIGCGSSPPAQQPAPVPADESFERISSAARAAFEQANYEQALKLYQQALTLAYARDDLGSIIDAQFNAAVSAAELERYDDALARVRQAKAELARNGKTPLPALLLLEATVLYRQGELGAARGLVDQLLAGADENAGADGARRRAIFLGGLIAAEQADTSALQQALAALGVPDDPRLLADREELRGRAALALGDSDTAIAALARAAQLRGDTLDYRGTARVLGLAGNVAEQAKQPAKAAEYFLRAGRSAAAQNAGASSNARARAWLERAVRLSQQVGDQATASEARVHLRRLARGE